MSALDVLKRDRELHAPAPRGAVKSEQPDERLRRLFQQAGEIEPDSSADRRWRAYWRRQSRRAQF